MQLHWFNDYSAWDAYLSAASHTKFIQSPLFFIRNKSIHHFNCILPSTNEHSIFWVRHGIFSLQQHWIDHFHNYFSCHCIFRILSGGIKDVLLFNSCIQCTRSSNFIDSFNCFDVINPHANYLNFQWDYYHRLCCKIRVLFDFFNWYFNLACDMHGYFKYNFCSEQFQ